MKQFMIPLLATCLFTMMSSCKKPIRGCTDPNAFNYNPSATESDGSCKEMTGCLGYAPGFANSGNKGATLNNPFWDMKMSQEVAIQRQFFNGVPAAVYILYEPGPVHRNAYANSDGEILFGYHMFYHTVQVYGELPVAGILAHEWGHRTQFTAGWQDYGRTSRMELEADAFSGFYMALAKQFAWSQIQSYFMNVYASGDYNFNLPSHHGTPDQRLQAAYLGVQTAVNALQTNTQYTYAQLHQLFMNKIRTQITPGRLGQQQFKEVKYPKGLTFEKVSKLFPRF